MRLVSVPVPGTVVERSLDQAKILTDFDRPAALAADTRDDGLLKLVLLRNQVNLTHGDHRL